MPPKTQKQKEEEAARLAEEQRLKEEEERKRLEEIKKYQVSQLGSNLKLPITLYYIENINQAQDALKFSVEYITKLLEVYNCVKNFRPIDIQITADQVLNDFIFSTITLKLDQKAAQVLTNILFLVYIFGNNKFSEEIQQSVTKGKTLEKDKQLFMKLLTQHSSDEYKFFKASQVEQILIYQQNGYFSHHQLITYAIQNDQRPLELHVDLDVDTPLPQPALDDGVFKPVIEEKQENQQSIHTQHQEEEQVKEPTDEELLDPIIMQVLEQKLREAKEELETKLENRRVELEEKIKDLANPKKGKK
ncbi:hypothetical protein pb186bvf_002313 [Paramecium bursaria]